MNKAGPIYSVFIPIPNLYKNYVCMDQIFNVDRFLEEENIGRWYCLGQTSPSTCVRENYFCKKPPTGTIVVAVKDTYYIKKSLRDWQDMPKKERKCYYE